MSELKVTRVRGGYILEYWMGAERILEVFTDYELLMKRLAETVPDMSVPQ